jgi:hypothetical protein
MVDGGNLFTYVRGNPLRLVDSTGTQGHPGQGGGEGAGAAIPYALTGVAGVVERAREAAERALKEKLEEEKAIAELTAGGPEPVKGPTAGPDPHPNRHGQTVVICGADFTGLDLTVKKEVQVWATDEEAKRMEIEAGSEFNMRTIAAAAGGVAQMGAARSANQAAGSPMPDQIPQQWGSPTTQAQPSLSVPPGLISGTSVSDYTARAQELLGTAVREPQRTQTTIDVGPSRGSGG